MIEIRNVRYQYPSRVNARRHIDYKWDGLEHANAEWALDNVSLDIAEGEYIVLAGASGSGKSTLLRLLNGLIPQFYGGVFEGYVRVRGRDTRTVSVREWLSDVGLVFQNPGAQLWASSVEREIAFGLENLGLDRAEIRARLEWAAEVTGVTPLLARAPHDLSGGEQQRVALAAVLALRPRVIALDEPFTHLDPMGAAQLCAILRELARQGLTLIVAEHHLSDLIADATRLIVLANGRIALDGAPREVLCHDLTGLNVNVPLVVRAAREQGLNDGTLSRTSVGQGILHDSVPEVPLTVAEALQLGVTLAPPTSLKEKYSAAGRVLEAQQVGFTLEGRDLLNAIEFEIERGEIVALVGPNGAGKTTLLKHFDALYKPTRGRMRVLNQDTRHARVSDLAAQVALVWQNPNDQLFKLTVREEIAVGAQAVRRYDPQFIQAVSEQFGLNRLMDRSPFRLSEGEKKRVTFAAALATQPEIIVLDEPTVGQDEATRAALAEWIGRSGKTVVLATHDLEFAEMVAPRWIVLANGRILADGAPDEIMARPDIMQQAGLRPTPRFELAARRIAAPEKNCP